MEPRVTILLSEYNDLLEKAKPKEQLTDDELSYVIYLLIKQKITGQWQINEFNRLNSETGIVVKVTENGPHQRFPLIEIRKKVKA